jgi:hypothetical protein
MSKDGEAEDVQLPGIDWVHSWPGLTPVLANSAANGLVFLISHRGIPKIAGWFISKNPKISEKSHGGFCYIQVACLRTDIILFNLLDRWSSWHSQRFRRVWVLSGQAEPRTLGTQGGDEGFCWRVWGVETSWIWDLAIKYMCFLDWDHDFNGDKWLIINKWDSSMTWVCLKMMYTPSSWKVFHRDRIFLTNRCWGSPYVQTKPYLVGGLEPWNFMMFHSVGNFIIPTDDLIFFRRGWNIYILYKHI